MRSISGGQNNSYVYDNNGNTTAGAGRTISWDVENRPVTITLGSITTTFAYDGDGKRVKKSETNGSSVTTTVYIGNYLEKVFVNSTLTDTVKYYYAGGKRIAMRRSPTGGSETLSYMFAEHLGGTSVVLNTSSGVTSTVSYYPYGGTRASTGVSQTDYLFTGQRSDSSVGLYDYGARRYDASSGRFISPDTLVPKLGNPQTLNRYAYALNNPLKYNDPDGHFVNFVVQAAVGAVSGAAIAYGVQVVGNIRDNGLSVQAFTNVDARQVVAGAVAGGVSAVTFGAAVAAGGAIGFSSTGSTIAANMVSGQVANVTSNLVMGEAAFSGSLDPGSIAMDIAGPIGGKAARSLGIRRSSTSTKDLAAAKDSPVGGTYMLRDAETEEVVYVGRTNDLDRRAREHQRSGDKGNLSFKIDRRTDDYMARRGREQVLYDVYEPELNRIRPVRRNHPDYDDYMAAAQQVD